MNSPAYTGSESRLVRILKAAGAELGELTPREVERLLREHAELYDAEWGEAPVGEGRW